MRSASLSACSIALWLGMCPCGMAGDVDHEQAKRIKQLRQSWTEKVHRISRREYEATLEYWSETAGPVFSFERVGQSTERLPIYLLKITEAAVPDRNKQVALIVSLHGGPERTGTTTILHLCEWLLGDSEAARRTRRHQIILLMPIVNPHAFFVTDRFGNAHGIDPYTGGGVANWDLDAMTYKALDKAPEIQAFLSVVDRYQPEICVDLHGTGLQEYPDDKLGDRRRFHGQTMFEVTGSAYSNYALRPWDWRVTESMVRAGAQRGYPSDRFEADAERAFWGPAMQPLADRLWRGRPNFYTAQYSYAHYHTLLAALEIGWEESGVARLRGLLEIGNSCWQGRPAAGYPVDRVKNFIGHYVVAWGTDAASRRQSRVELWQRQGAFCQAVLYPQTDGRDTFFVATTPAAAAQLDPDPATFLENLRRRPRMQHEAVASYVRRGPEIKLAIERARKPARDPQPIRHGLALQLRIPYRQPDLLDLRLNGHPLEPDARDGYQRWVADGFTMLQINVPPEKAQVEDLYLVTCSYLPDTPRRYGWQPPAAVMRRLHGERD